jgi:L-arabinose isomerase
VRAGRITTLNLTQTGDGMLKFISSEGESTKGPIMQLGNTQTPVKFRMPPDAYMKRWFGEAPTHHCAMSIGHNAELFQCVADLMSIAHVTL